MPFLNLKPQSFLVDVSGLGLETNEVSYMTNPSIPTNVIIILFSYFTAISIRIFFKTNILDINFDKKSKFLKKN